MEILKVVDATMDTPGRVNAVDIHLRLTSGDFEDDAKGPFGTLKLTPHTYGKLLGRVLSAWNLIHR